MAALEVLAAEERELRAQPGGGASMGADYQTFLAHVVRSRTLQRLPPFFALLTGPTLPQPYRMEELSVSLGRITPARRLADVHVSDSTAVSHLHAQIEFRVHHNHYVLVNHAHNGTKLKTIESEDWTELRDPEESAPLPNPAMIDVGGAYVFFQVFYVGKEDRKPPKVLLRPLDLPVSFAAPAAKASSGGPTKGSRQGGGPAFVDLIVKALVSLGGRATQRQIAEYVEAQWPEVAQRSNWRNSVSGVLSVNTPELFEAEPVTLPNGKRARFMMWSLKRRPNDEPAAASGSPSVEFNKEAVASLPPVAPTFDASEESEKKPIVLKERKKPGPKPGWKLALQAKQAAEAAAAAAAGLPPPVPDAPKKKRQKKPKAPKD